jgi:hypothetical protein
MTKRIRMLLARSTRSIRLWAVLAALGLLMVFAGLVLAAAPTGHPTGPVRDDVYRPGKGCGDRNHVHVPNPGKKPCPPQAGPKR